jgi:hypothetical protein
MQVVEVDVLHAQTLETRVAGSFDIPRCAVDLRERSSRPVADETDFRCHDGLIAPSTQGFAHKLLVGAVSIKISSVEEVDTPIKRLVDGRERLGFIAHTICLGHPHAAQADPRDAYVTMS